MKRVGRKVAMSSTSFLTSPWKYPILAPTDRNISSVDLYFHSLQSSAHMLVCPSQIASSLCRLA